MKKHVCLMVLGFIALAAVTTYGQAAASGSPKTKTKISMEQARKIALEKQPGTIKSAELEKEKGKLIYSFDIKAADGLHEVNIDAYSGAILENKLETPAEEAKEKQQEAKEKAAKEKKPH